MHYGIIAAGEGSRLRQEGVDRPKPLVSLNGTPMIERLIRLFIECGAESVSIIVNEQMTDVQQFLDALVPTLPVPVSVIVKSTPSSMHSFYELSQLMRGKGRFILTTVDTIFRAADFARYVEAFEAAGADTDGMMAMTDFVDDEKPLYIDVDADFNILDFRDNPWAGVRYISGGIYGLSEPAIGILEDCMSQGVSRMRNYQRALVAGGLRLKGFPMGKIIDVDHAADIEVAEKFINS